MLTQKRHDAETLLFARGYVSLNAVEVPIADALREYEILTAKQDIIEDALRQIHEAAAVLPGYSAYPPGTMPNTTMAVLAESFFFERAGSMRIYTIKVSGRTS